MSPMCSRNARAKKALVGHAQWGTLRVILGNVHEQAWKDHLYSLAAALSRNGESRRAGVGRVRSLAFLSILRGLGPLARCCSSSAQSSESNQ